MRILVTFIVVVLLSIADVQADCSGMAEAQASGCNGSVGAARRTAVKPVRNTLGLLAKIVRRPAARRGCNGAAVVAGCSGSSMAVGCSGARALGCSGSQMTIVTRISSPSPVGCSGSFNAPPAAPKATGCACGCSMGDCNCQQAAGTQAFSVSQQSANYRAANRIKGHTRFEAGRMAGVGFSSFNPNPATCFNNMGGQYSVARGSDGWYATRIVN